jgi:hypothetical protein
MKRQIRRRIKREWDRVKVDVVYSVTHSKTLLEPVSFIMVDNFVKVDDCILFRCPLNFAQVWYGMVYLVIDGFPFSEILHIGKVGVGSDAWLEMYFGQDDEDFEF